MALLAVMLAVDWRPANAAPIPLDFDKNAVQFLFTKSGTNYFPLGTCFGLDTTSVHRPKKFLNVITLRSPITQHARYFVTAKHVLFDTSDQLRPDIYFRINNQTGGISYFLLNPDITNGSLRVITHTNKAVDLAAITVGRPAFSPMRLKGDVALNLQAFDASIIATDKVIKKHQVREGDEMFFLGLFTPFYGSKQNVPICRFGRLAMMSEEQMPWGTEGPENLYLMETEAFGGNSGSPAFFHFPGGRGVPFI